MPNFSSVQSIPRISVSRGSTTYEAGKFDNAYIKALNLEVGITDNPSSINLGLINEKGKYADHHLSYLDEYLLKLGDDLSIWCYLIGQKKSTGSDGKTSEIELVDGSHILDRVFVGGVGVHSIDPFYFNTNIVDDVRIPVSCPPCYTQQLINVPDPNAAEIYNIVSRGQAVFPNDIAVDRIYTERVLKSSIKGGAGGNRDGGYILLGEEKFTKTSCDLADIDYSFQDLIEACANMGIEILISDKSRPKLPNGAFAPSTLRRSHWGTLRSVLKNWCADFGTSFTYDYSKLVPTVIEVPLGIPTRSAIIKDIIGIAKLIKTQNTSIGTTSGVVNVSNEDGAVLIGKIDENRSLKGSFKNTVITAYKKESTKRSFSKDTYYRTGYKCFQTTDVLSYEARSARSGYEFNTCCYLAKYDQSIRTLYLTWLAGQRYHSSLLTTGVGDGAMYRALGFNVTTTLSKQLQDEIIDECLNVPTYREVVEKWLVPHIDEFDMFLGTYSKEVATKHAEFEKSFAEDFLGKWWFTNLHSFADAKYGGFKQCFTGADWRYEIESSLSPEVKDTATNLAAAAGNKNNLQTRLYNQAKLPFAKNLWGPIPQNPWAWYDWFSDARGKVYNRTDAPWFPDQEKAEDIFKLKTPEGAIDLAAPFLPRYQEIAGIIETRLKARFGGTNIPIGDTIDGIKDKSIPCLMIAPKPARIGQILNVGKILPMENPNETPYYFNKGSSMGNKLDCGESLKCEIQEGLEKEACKPALICAGYPQLPPASITTENGIGKIIAARDAEPFAEGVINQFGGGLNIIFAPPLKKGDIHGPFRNFKLVGPAGTFQNVNDIYLANYKESIKSDYHAPKIEKFLGDEKLAFDKVGNVSEVKLTLNNVSSNDPIFSAKDPITGEVTVITKVYISGYGFLNLEEYHNMVAYLSEQGTKDPTKHDVSISFGNLNFGVLSNYLNAQSGLNKLSCSIDGGGISASASWSNRPATPPSQDLFTTEIQPQIMSRRSNFQ